MDSQRKQLMTNREVRELIGSIVVDHIQIQDHVAVAPLIGPPADGFVYWMAEQAFAEGVLEVTEVSDHGLVSEVKVTNHASHPVLFLDGAQLIGASQDRIVNTTILVPARSETRIPVSCTEQGRWHAVSTHFQPADYVMYESARARKVRAVSHTLETAQSYQADQAEVWRDVAAAHAAAHSHSATGALRDAYAEIQGHLTRFIERLRPLPGQTGLLVFCHGRVLGLDHLSRADAYARVHDKLLRSYLMEAWMRQSARRTSPARLRRQASAFLTRLLDLPGKCYPSPGLGTDIRLVAPDILGAALVVEDRVLHLAAFGGDAVPRHQRRVPGPLPPEGPSTPPNQGHSGPIRIHDLWKQHPISRRWLRKHRPPSS